MPMLYNLGIRERLLYIFPCIRIEREKPVPNGRASLFNKSTVVWCGVYSYRQRYSSSQWSKCHEPRGAADWHRRFLFFTTISTSNKTVLLVRDHCVTIAWPLRDHCVTRWHEQRCLYSYEHGKLANQVVILLQVVVKIAVDVWAIICFFFQLKS